MSDNVYAQINDRSKLIFKKLVESYLKTGSPAGDPVLRYDSTNFLKINFDLSLICAYTLSDIRILFKNNIYLLLLNLYEKR